MFDFTYELLTFLADKFATDIRRPYYTLINLGTLAWRNPLTEEPRGCKESDKTEQPTLSLFFKPRHNRSALLTTGDS